VDKEGVKVDDRLVGEGVDARTTRQTSSPSSSQPIASSNRTGGTNSLALALGVEPCSPHRASRPPPLTSPQLLALACVLSFFVILSKDRVC